VTGSGPASVLKTAMQGEDQAISAYERALNKDISSGTRTVAQRQLEQIQSARRELEQLLDATQQ